RASTAALGVRWSSRLSNRCSVPMEPWCRRRASCWAPTTTCRASAVKRSNMSVLPPERPAAARVLLVHGLPGDAEELGDLVPRPALVSGVADLEGLQPLAQHPQGPDPAEPGCRVLAAGGGGHLRCVCHGCQPRLLSCSLSTLIDSVGGPASPVAPERRGLAWASGPADDRAQPERRSPWPTDS